MDTQPVLDQKDKSEIELNLAEYRLPEALVETPSRRKRVAAKKAHYVRTIPLGWLERAAQLPGCALQVGVFVWFHYGLHGSKERVVFSPSQGERHGLNRRQVQRGLKQLEEAGLIEIERGANKSPKVKPLWADSVP